MVGYEGLYDVSDYGDVWSRGRFIVMSNGKPRTCPAKLMRPSDQSGYRRLTLRDAEGVKSSKYVHVLMLEAFVRPGLPGEEALHGDDDRSNNTLPNLKWGTRSENMREAVQRGRHHWSSREACSRGHRYIFDGLYDNDRQRICSSCAKARAAVRRQGRAGDEELIQTLADSYYADRIDGAMAMVPS